MMRVLGIDPGIERLGWAVLEKDGRKFNYLASGVKKTLKTSAREVRLLEIHDFLEKLISEHKPELVSLENIFFSNNAKTALIIGEVRGIILMLAAKHNLAVMEFGPAQIKLALAGYGRADKSSVLNMLKLTLNLPNKKFIDDESDAIAIACCGIIHSGTLQTNQDRLFSKEDYKDHKGRI